MTEELAGAINQRVHCRYMSEAALADPRVGGIFACWDHVTIKLQPESWISWDMAALDARVFGAWIAGTPGYLLPHDG